MLSQLRQHLTYSNVMATVALFIALGGTSYAALEVGTREIRNNSVRSTDLRNGNVRGKDIRNGDVRGADLRNGDVTGSDLRNGSATGADIQDRSVTGADLAPDSLDGRAVTNLGLGDFAPGQLPDAVPATLPSGKTLKGVFAVAVTGGSGQSSVARAPISFQVPLASDPQGTFVAEGTDPPPECPGRPPFPWPPAAGCASSRPPHSDRSRSGASSIPSAAITRRPAGSGRLHP